MRILTSLEGGGSQSRKEVSASLLVPEDLSTLPGARPLRSPSPPSHLLPKDGDFLMNS